MSLFARLASRLVPSVLVVTMLAGGAGCANSVEAEPDTVATTDATSSALSASTSLKGAMDPGSFLLDIAEDLIKGAIDKAVFGDGIDYERINKMFQDDLQKFADKEHVRDAGVHVTGTLQTLRLVVGSYDPNAPVDRDQISLLNQRVDRLNDDLASMRSEDVKKVGLRTYLWAATVQHTVLKTLAVIDKEHAAQHTMQLRIALGDHIDYVDGRVIEFQADAAARIGKVTDCTYQGGWFGNNWCWFDDKGADYGNDEAIPSVEGRFYGDQVRAYSWDRARAWGVPQGTVWHNAEATVGHSAPENCSAARTAYLVDMQDKLDHLSGFVADANLPDTRVLLATWKDALAALGGPVSK